MRKNPTRRSVPARLNYGRLLSSIASTHRDLQQRVVSTVNEALVLRNWLIGAYLVEYEQGGADRAKYGDRLLVQLATDLEKRNIKGCSRQMLERMRQFYR